MKSYKLILLLLGLTMLTSRGKSQNTLPRNLDESIQYFQQNWGKAELRKFKNK